MASLSFVLEMEEDMLDTSDDHLRTIIHIDIDCFYAQVEELRDPSLKTKPLGIQQKNIVVTCNYVARQHGIGKLMLLSEAKRLCPNLILVNGEDLTNYRKMSANIFNVLHSFTTNIEKLGIDENFLDVTQIINEKLSEYAAQNFHNFPTEPDGYLYPENETLNSCLCGCAKRFILGSHLAKEMRNKLYSELGITSCAGVAHNKLMAKICGSKNKPNKQTVLVPSFTTTVMTSLTSLRSIVGIGEKTEVLLNEIGVRSVLDLQDIEMYRLIKKFGPEMATKLKDLSYGRDYASVKPSGKPKSISLEDSCKSISLRADVEEKFRLLLIRLVNQVTEDGRIPIVIKIILRKFDSAKKTSHRETKQANIMPSVFKQLGDGKILLSDGGQEKLLKIVMRLFERSVDLKRPFNITLLGLAFSKFQEKKKGSKSIANFLIKKSDVEVQSVTSLSSDGFSPNTSETTHRYVSSSPMHMMDFESISDASHASCSSDVSESEIEPSPKKTRIGFLIAKRRCFSPSDSFDAASPSKLRVSDLRLNSKEFDRPDALSSSSSSNQPPITSTPNQSPSSVSNSFRTKSPLAITTDTSNLYNSLPPDCPPTVDQEVFKELPMDVQQELLTQWRHPSNTSSSSSSNNSQQPAQQSSHSSSSSSKSTTNNTLHRYFIANKQR